MLSHGSESFTAVRGEKKGKNEANSFALLWTSTVESGSNGTNEVRVWVCVCWYACVCILYGHICCWIWEWKSRNTLECEMCVGATEEFLTVSLELLVEMGWLECVCVYVCVYVETAGDGCDVTLKLKRNPSNAETAARCFCVLKNLLLCLVPKTCSLNQLFMRNLQCLRNLTLTRHCGVHLLLILVTSCLACGCGVQMFLRCWNLWNIVLYSDCENSGYVVVSSLTRFVGSV